MSTSENNNLNPVPSVFNSDNRHVVHFYHDGNLLLNVQGKFFRVHKCLCRPLGECCDQN